MHSSHGGQAVMHTQHLHKIQQAAAGSRLNRQQERHGSLLGLCHLQVLVKLQQPVIRLLTTQQLLVLLLQAGKGSKPALPCALQLVQQHMHIGHNVLLAH